MNQRLLETARAEKPDLVFSVLFTDEFDAAVIEQISDFPEVTTLNWFCDDDWRFDNYSKLWAPHFNWVVTTATSAVSNTTSCNSTMSSSVNGAAMISSTVS